jgi:DNA (cytosine-5)-methyltransferase 1
MIGCFTMLAKTSIGTKIVAVDLFCGVGGLTHGLTLAGIDVRLGVDLDPACRHPFVANNDARFLLKSVSNVKGSKLRRAMKGSELTLLAGCAPCQPFSKYSQGRGPDERWFLLEHFARLVEESEPDFVTMENVPRLKDQGIFQTFLERLANRGYRTTYCVVNCSDYGVPQDRRRLVLLASKHGQVLLVPPTTPGGTKVTVRDAIGRLEPIIAGGKSRKDRLHFAANLSETNIQRIRKSEAGGSWKDWPNELVSACHARETGRNYSSVYGRMSWDSPAPTLTTQFYGFGSGRFGHPEQDRALSLREGAIIQSFPEGYRFTKRGERPSIKTIGRLIGNAVPVKLGEAIGRSFIIHAQEIGASL